MKGRGGKSFHSVAETLTGGRTSKGWVSNAIDATLAAVAVENQCSILAQSSRAAHPLGPHGLGHSPVRSERGSFLKAEALCLPRHKGRRCPL